MKSKLLILIALLILLIRLQEINIYRSKQVGDQLPFKIWWVKKGNNCWRSQAGYLFLVPNCQIYQTGQRLSLVGRVEGVSDNKKNQQKSLAIQQVSLIDAQADSLNYWFAQIFIFTHQLRQKILIFWQQILGYSGGSLLFSLIFGGRTALPEKTSTAIDLVGLSFIFSASGMHVGLLMQKLEPKLKNQATQIKMLIIFLVLAVYGTLTLWRPAIFRAVMMVLLRQLAKLVFFRPSHPLINWLVAFYFSLVMRPLWWFSVGFWLSYSASLAIIVVSHFSHQPNRFLIWELGDTELEQADSLGLHARHSWLDRLRSYTREILVFSLTAQLATLPLVAVNFGQVSWLSLLSSWLVLGVLSLVFTWGIKLSILSLLVLLNVEGSFYQSFHHFLMLILSTFFLPLRISAFYLLKLIAVVNNLNFLVIKW